MSGWQTATIKTDADRKKELNMVLNEKAKKGEIDEKLSDNSLGLHGYDAGIKDKCGEILKEIEAEVGDQVLIIKANDTTDSGEGQLWRVTDIGEEIKLMKVDTKTGYEGAMARDVTGYFREEHDIEGFSRVY